MSTPSLLLPLCLALALAACGGLPGFSPGAASEETSGHGLRPPDIDGGAAVAGCALPRMLCGQACLDPSQPTHCGACDVGCRAGERCEARGDGGYACAPASAPPRPSAPCVAGLANCTQDPRECSTDLRTSASHCGACGRACRAGQTCIQGACVQNGVAVECAGGAVAECPVFPNSATPSCMAGRCVPGACTPGWVDADGEALNGCEARSTVARCGARLARCEVPSGARFMVATCVEDTCGVTCASGHRDADGLRANGCEVASGTDPLRCGAAGARCASSDAMHEAVCVDGRCQDWCPPGSREERGRCLPLTGDLPSPRVLEPAHAATVGPTPTFRLALDPSVDGARVEVCVDPRCGIHVAWVESAASAPGFAEGRLGTALAEGVYWVRAWGRRGGATGALGGAPRAFMVHREGLSRPSRAAPDLNNDGIAELVYAVPSRAEVVVRMGFGAGAWEASPRVLRGGSGSLFGTTLGTAELTGDGFLDLVVGAPLESGGALWLYPGGASGVDHLGGQRLVSGDGGLFGAALALADLDRDGLDDVAVGAPAAAGERGAVTVFFGQAGGRLSAPVSVLPRVERSPGTRFGTSLERLSTPEGALLVVGSPGWGGGRGALEVFRVGPAGAVALAHIDPTWPEGLGAGVVPTADLDGDGTEELALRDPDAHGGRGAVRVLSGRELLSGRAVTLRYREGAEGEGFGAALTPVAVAGEPLPGLAVGTSRGVIVDAWIGGGSRRIDLPGSVSSLSASGGLAGGSDPLLAWVSAPGGWSLVTLGPELSGPTELAREREGRPMVLPVR
ncbi:MAG: FG-GAP repeat protein [Deltaproteobacteria bacterium]|nr:FG-GAP repeat protein [Deltaproteobacteria bacterium]